MTSFRPFALTIAGFDPSGGAGILADIKTFEQNCVYGLGVATAITYQNDIEFLDLEWVETEKIIKQIEVLLRRFEIKYIKIGLIKNFTVFQSIVEFLYVACKNPIIVFDPILKASAGFVFNNFSSENSALLMKGIYCITPNLPEMKELFGSIDNAIQQTSIYLKGGHDLTTDAATDILFCNKNKYTFEHYRLPMGEKHGSGCVLSAAITAQLALGYDLPTASKRASDYTHQFLASNDTLLGYHNNM